MRMRQMLREPGDYSLDPANIINITNNYPQFLKDGKVNWAVIGGGAVMTLLCADDADGCSLKTTSSIPDRKHKDLELIVLRNCRLAKKMKAPMQLFGSIDYSEILDAIPIAEKDPSGHGFYVEMLRGYNFGSPVPTEQDVTTATAFDGKRIAVAKPEFIAATKLFKTRTLRDCDRYDVRALTEKFELDIDYAHSIAQKTHFSFASKDDIAAAIRLAHENDDVEKFLHALLSKQVNPPMADPSENIYQLLTAYSLLPREQADQLHASAANSIREIEERNENVKAYRENNFGKFTDEPAGIVSELLAYTLAQRIIYAGTKLDWQEYHAILHSLAHSSDKGSLVGIFADANKGLACEKQKWKGSEEAFKFHAAEVFNEIMTHGQKNTALAHYLKRTGAI